MISRLTFIVGTVLSAASTLQVAVSAPVTGETNVPSASGSPARPIIEQGYNALQVGKVDQAAALFRRALATDPKAADAYIGLAEVERRRGKPKEAVARIQEGLVQLPKSGLLMSTMARFKVSEGRNDEALSWQTRAVEVEPNNAVLYNELGNLQMQLLRQPEQAEKSFRKAISLAPDAVRPRIGLALVLVSKGNHKAAIEQLQAADDLDRTTPEIPYLLGRVRGASGDLPGGYRDFSQALQRRPDFAPALRDRADIAAELKRDADAIADYERILKDSPKDAPVMVKLGMVLDRVGRDAEAARWYEEALKINPSFAPAYNNLAWMSVKSGADLDKALSMAQKAVKLAPTVPQFQDTLGSVYRARGEAELALAAFKRATELAPPLAEAYFHLGQSYRNAGRTEEAKAAFRRALEIAPNFDGADEARKALAL
jgi:tetratricopeptide (TPR) repeat protein